MNALWKRTAANGIEREWLNAKSCASANQISPGWAVFLCRQRHCQLPRSDGGNGKNFPGQGGEIIYNAEVSALSEHKNGGLYVPVRAVNMKHRR